MRKKEVVQSRPYYYNPHIYFEDYYINGELIAPGTLLKLKNDRTAWTFSRRVINSELGVEWIELMSPYGWRSVRPEKVMGTFIKKPVRRRRKVNNDEQDSA